MGSTPMFSPFMQTGHVQGIHMLVQKFYPWKNIATFYFSIYLFRILTFFQSSNTYHQITKDKIKSSQIRP